MTPAAFQFIASAIAGVDGNDGRATDVVVTAVTAVAPAVGALYAVRWTLDYFQTTLPRKPSNNMTAGPPTSPSPSSLL
jgi:hypothetical protein